jgi:hypothetical protein
MGGGRQNPMPDIMQFLPEAGDQPSGWESAQLTEKVIVVEDGRFTSTERGSPQGGVISPLLR